MPKIESENQLLTPIKGHNSVLIRNPKTLPPQGQIISLTGLSALSIALWKPNVIVSSLALDFERVENRKVISMWSASFILLAISRGWQTSVNII